MGVPKRAYSGVFIGENAHRSRSIVYTYTETALALRSMAILRALGFPSLISRCLSLACRRGRVIVGVVFVVIDGAAKIVLALVNLLTLLSSQVASIRPAIELRLAIDA